jgi:patatin-related protein
MTGVGGTGGSGGTDTSLWRELRIAPILTGGTSLAVWIGGVTAELYRAVNCLDEPRPVDRVYARLLELTRTRALVDVVTGTSAGGLNGVLLATSWSMRVPTDDVVRLRDTWMDLGDITSLLRSPNDKNPPSLLRGDDYFWPQLTQVSSTLAESGAVTRASGAGGVQRRPVDLALTVTTLSGELTRRTDDLGQELSETRQDHTIRFRTEDFGGDDPTWARRLALASRTSASIPGVFEASYLPVDQPALDRPAFGSRASFSVGRWAVDGGVLANQPIGAALGRIIEQSADRELRRVALFVNPTPSEGPPNVGDDPRVEPPLAKVAASAFTAPRHIGIRHEIDDLRAYNERVRTSVDVGRGIARMLATTSSGGTESVETMARSLYPKFRNDRAVLSVASMLDRIGPDILERGFPRKQVEQALVDAVRSTDHWLPHTLDSIDVGPDWQWGLAPLDHYAGLLVELVRRAFRLPTWIVDDGARTELGTVRKAVHDALARSAEARDLDTAFWREVLAERPDELYVWARHCYQAWPDASRMSDRPDGGAGGEAGGEDLAARVKATSWEAALDLAACTQMLLATLTELGLDGVGDGEAAEVRDDLGAIADLASLLTAGDTSLPADKVRRMIALHIVAVSLGDTSRRPAEIELVEVSWRAPNALDPQRPVSDKLAGTEFSRLGAFVKRSWRANDWMWGRMDGAAQLVRLLLDPRRLRQLGLTASDVIAALDDVSADGVTDDERRELEEELGYLYPQAHEMVPVPATLPCTTEAFLRRVQLDIAREELPEVHFAVLRSVAEGAGEGDGGDFCRAFAAATTSTPAGQLSDAEVERLFRRCRIGAETAATEVGQDSLTRTAGATVLVAANAVTGERSGLRWPSRVSRPFRQLALLGYVLTRSATATSKTGLAITAVLSAVAGAIVAMFLLSGRTEVAVNSGLVLLALVILGGGVFLAILRSGVFAALPGFLALLVVALALIGPGMSEIVTGTAERDPDLSWRHVVFLGSWSIVTIVLVVASVGWVLSAVARLRAAERLHSIAVAQAEHRGTAPPARPRGAFVELVCAALLIPLVLAVHQPFLRWFMVGDDEGWRAWLIDASTWLGDRAIVMVLAGVVVFGVFFGLAWDRSVGAVLDLFRRRLRSLFHRAA